MNYCNCGNQAAAKCTQCSTFVCGSHRQNSHTRADSMLANYQALTARVATKPRADARVLCEACHGGAVRRTLEDLAGQLRAEGTARGTAWMLALDLWSAREGTGNETYAQIVGKAAGWGAHLGRGPFAVALDAFKAPGSGSVSNPMPVVFTYRTRERRTLFGTTKKSERKEETLGQINGWLVRYQESSDEYARIGGFFLRADGQVYANSGIGEEPPGTARHAIYYQHSYAERAGSQRKDVDAARSYVTGWLAEVTAGTAEPPEPFHCERCELAASVKVARIVVGLR
ncbi:hypothetical protein Ait01nite_016370 [Actinoplanes italicus]|uniref:Uncharacterized protein n=1 Tax=Actinoplanes italicus TaxID=113567 RepID=A0A2T0JZ70_9ACTN|nr:hypothetical protein [Actinoplanes italicus]PRX15794.1 hypothetical protein CLV67_12233 [Actinoplanes italicus]GIE28592.1 hypothetical protein Ait01nite_016370 [Actinoplanes italicus]